MFNSKDKNSNIFFTKIKLIIQYNFYRRNNIYVYYYKG